MASQVHQFLALSAWQKRAMALAWVSLPICHAGLALFGLAKVQAWVLKRPMPSANPSNPAPFGLEGIRSLGTAVNRAARYPKIERACLRRSLVLLWLLRRHGVEAKLCIGVRFLDGALDAHAWVEWHGHPVNDRADVGRDFASFGEFVPVQAFRSA
jgi:hypothetical protein